MNAGQEQFFNFILGNVKDGNQEKAEALLKEAFSKQADGTFNPEYLETFNPQMLALIKEDSLEQVKNIMMNFKTKL